MTVNLLSILLYTGCVQGFILAVFLLKFSTVKGAKVFGMLVIVLSFHLVLVANDSRAFFMKFPHLLHISWVISALYWPLVLIFVRRITRVSVSFKWAEALFFLPFVFMVIYHSPFFLSSSAFKRDYIDDFEKSVIDDFGLMNQLVSWMHVVFFVSALVIYERYQKRILNFMANEEARIIWLGQFLKITSVIVSVGLAVFYAKKFDISPISSLYPYHFLGVIFLIYWSAYKLMRQPVIFNSEKEEQDFAIEKADNETPPQQNRELAKQLKELMENDKLYRVPGLTLSDLAEKTRSNKQYVSEAINQVYEKNFYDFVNEFRLREFTEQLKDPKKKQYTLLALAYDSGFNSKATFNAVFKKHYGTTPSHFYKSQKVA